RFWIVRIGRVSFVARDHYSSCEERSPRDAFARFIGLFLFTREPSEYHATANRPTEARRRLAIVTTAAMPGNTASCKRLRPVAPSMISRSQERAVAFDHAAIDRPSGLQRGEPNQAIARDRAAVLPSRARRVGGDRRR